LEGDSPFKNGAAIELIVKPSIRSAMAAEIDLTFTPYVRIQGSLKVALNLFQHC
jgi:hypothetical protein